MRSFKVTFKRGVEEVAVVHGNVVLRSEDLTLAELERVQVEAFLEKLTGHRVHIDEDTPENI